jgi:hypothetical protein
MVRILDSDWSRDFDRYISTNIGDSAHFTVEIDEVGSVLAGMLENIIIYTIHTEKMNPIHQVTGLDCLNFGDTFLGVDILTTIGHSAHLTVEIDEVGSVLAGMLENIIIYTIHTEKINPIHQLTGLDCLNFGDTFVGDDILTTIGDSAYVTVEIDEQALVPTGMLDNIRIYTINKHSCNEINPIHQVTGLELLNFGDTFYSCYSLTTIGDGIFYC